MTASPFQSPMTDRNLLNSRLPTLWHGGDYNPEQWPRAVWDEDVRLMGESRFRVATLGVFSWAKLEPEEGRFDFEWLDEIIDRLDRADRYFILATPSAAQPGWMSRKYPEVLRAGPDRVRRLHGNRVNYNYSSPIYRERSRDMARRLAERYGDHPRLLAWHLSNEYSGADYGAESIAAFRLWLRERYGSLDALNAAYWATFWSHTYSDWEELDAPGMPHGETAVPALTVDWWRFVTDQTVSFMQNEGAPLRELSPHVPHTTNMMSTYPGLDYRKFAPHLDFASWDSYPAFDGPFEATPTWVGTAFKHDLVRCLNADRKFMLMEISPSSSNWYSSMAIKAPGIHRFEALQAIAHGADGVQYFQWRASRGSQEQFHGAVVGHAGGAEARVFRDVKRVGEDLDSFAEVAGSRVRAEVAILYDWEARWALDAACGPVLREKGYEATAIAHYRPFWESGISVDVIGMDDALDGYRVVVAPMAYSLRPGFAERVRAFVERGGTFVTTYLSGWTDASSLVFEGGFLGPLKETLGIWSEELDALSPEEHRTVHFDGTAYAAHDLCELIHTTTAETLATYASGFYAGRPALTLNRLGSGRAYYVASRNEGSFTAALIGRITRESGVVSYGEDLPAGVTVQYRRGEGREWTFFLNATPEPKAVSSAAWGEIALAPWDVQVREGKPSV